MKIIIAGANGFVGSSLVNKFAKAGARVFAIDVSFAHTNFQETSLVSKIESNFADLDSLESRINERGFDAFYNLAWQGVNGPDKSRYDVQINNIITSLRCADLAKRLSCKKYLCAGTIAERAVECLPFLEKTSPGLMYACAKYCSHVLLENYCKMVNLSFVWMQFSNIFGPNNTTGNLMGYTLTQLRHDLPAIFGPAEQPYDFIYIGDLLEAVYRLGTMRTNENFYFIGSGSPMILKDYLIKVGSALSKPNLIQIGVREDDNIKYTFEMMDIKSLVRDIGEYVSGSFDDLIKYTNNLLSAGDNDAKV